VVIWLFVYGTLGIALAVYLAFVLGVIRMHSKVGERVHYSDQLNIAGTALNIFVLLVAVISLHVSVTTYQEAKRSGDEQTRALQSSRDALAAVARSVNSQGETLERSRQALDASVATAIAQQRLLSQSVANSKKQLGILQAEWAREMEQPDVHLALFYTDEFSVAVSNSGKKIARDSMYQGAFWNLSKPQNGAFQFASVKVQDVKYIRPGGGFAPTKAEWYYGNGGSPEAGDKLFGYMTVQCPDCFQERLYWVFFSVGGDGAYREGKFSEYSFVADAAAASAQSLLSSPGLLRLGKGNILH
jgi:hypothetical protein